MSKTGFRPRATEYRGRDLRWVYDTPIDTWFLADPLFLADAPIKDIHTFIGTFSIHANSSGDGDVPLIPKVEPLTAENVLWSNTVLAAGSAVGFVIYTGSETRAVMNTSHPETKMGLLDLEINRLAKVSGPYRG